MSWKSVEMQVALPRTQDAGKLQEQMSKQNDRFQESLAQSQLREQQLKRKRVNEFEKIKDKKLMDDNEDSKGSNEQGKEKNDDKHTEQDLNHPFLGNKIDFSG